MKDGLLEKIKGRGYWRFNFQPVVASLKLKMLNDCKEIVEKNSINLRGWDFPHIPLRNDNNGSIIKKGEFVQAWEDWSNYKEFWHMYKSGQFLYYRGLREDWFEEHIWTPKLSQKIQSGKNLGVLFSVIYELTETYLFLSRLTQSGLYNEGVQINISLYNLKDRVLWLEDNNRMPFLSPRRVFIDEFVYSERLTKDEILKNTKELAQNVILQLFDNFDWNPPRDFINAEQETLLSGKV